MHSLFLVKVERKLNCFWSWDGVTIYQGNIHGMPVAALVGLHVLGLTSAVKQGTFDPEKIAMIGIRSIDESEKVSFSFFLFLSAVLN